MIKKNVIIDCDPGHDDAIALLLLGSSDKVNLLGVCVTSGNQTIEKTSQNALNLCKFLKIDAPIAKGIARPIIKEVEICDAIHGESGLDGFTFPKYQDDYYPGNSVELIRKLCLENDKVTIIITGPMTNIALAIRLYPEIISHIDEIIFMGGSIANGNVSPAAEFNILCDPEAAHIVITSGVSVKMIGLDVTRKVMVYDHVVDRMGCIHNSASDLFVKLMRVFNENQRKTFGIEAGPLHDPVTVASLLDKDVVKFERMNVEIDLSHGPSYGRTNCDAFNYLDKDKNVDVAVDIDVDRFWNIIEEGLRHYE